MTYEERKELLAKCSKCEYAAKRVFPYDAEGSPITSRYTRERRYGAREFRVCKMLSLLCGEIDEPCPLPTLTEDEIEERETEFNESE